MTGNKSDPIGNAKLMSFGFEKQALNILKQGQQIKVNAFGVTLGAYSRIEELFKFLLRTKTTIIKVGEDVTSQIKDESYMKELKAAFESAQDLNISRSDMGNSDHSNDFKQMYVKQQTIKNTPVSYLNT
jgi:hypothetical protein